MRKWDLDRDGKIDASETEIARSRMRRARNEALMNSGTDPVTGRPRVPTDPATGRPLAPASAANAADNGRGGPSTSVDDGGLILVPGTGAATDGVAGSNTRPNASTTSPPQERVALPGNRVPSTTSTVPSVTPRIPGGGMTPGSQASGSQASGSQFPQSQPPGSGRDFGGGELSSRARILPGTPSLQNPLQNSQQNPTARDARPRGLGQERQPGTAERPGIISGGVRAGGVAARPGYGAGGPPADLNAGRLPGGLPQTRGIAPGTSLGPRSGAAAPPGAGRLAGPGQATPRTGTGSYRGPVAPSLPSTGVPSAGRPMVRQPDGARPLPQAPRTVPRVPRVSTDDFYGR